MNIYTNPQSHPAFPGVPGPAPGLKSNVYINPYMLHSKLFKELFVIVNYTPYITFYSYPSISNL